MEKLFGGNPASVLVKLIIASVIVGLLLNLFGYTRENIYQRFGDLITWLSKFGFGAVKDVADYLLLGAIVVVPIWIIARILNVLTSKNKPKA